MALNPVSALVGIVLIFLAPGYFLLQALFPGRRWYGPFHPFALPALSVAVSVAVVVVAGSILGFLPGEGPGGRGWFQGAQSFGGEGAPILESTLGGISLVLFLVAWWRGAFPLLGRSADYDNVAERGEPEDVTLLRDMRLEEERLRKEANRVRRRARESRDPGVRGALSEAAEDLDREREALAKRARDLEARAGARRYGKRDDARWRLRPRT